jgi:hypothetical protein
VIAFAHGDVVGWVAGGLAAGLLIRELLGLPFSQQAYALPDPLGGAGVLRLGGGVTVPVRAFEVLAIVLEAFVIAWSALGARWADVLALALLALRAATRPRGLLAA